MNLQILIAEQEDAFRQELVRALAGHEVSEAATGAEAMAALQRNPCPLVVTNVVVGDTCGLKLMEQAKELDPEAVVVVTTGDSHASKALHALRSGAYDYLRKPCDETVMAAVLRRAVERVALIRENQNLLASLERNIEALRLQNRRLEDMASHDGLTGLHNHRYFVEAFDQELARCRRHERTLSVIFADVDFFKKYNDTQGHQAGDVVLSTLGMLLRREARRATIVARYGGEEFVLLVPETGREGALQYAERIRSLVEVYPFPARKTLANGKVTLSLGVATFPDHGTDANMLLKYADDALYRAKASGRNTVCG
jgi:diguanylate cyclase (GGDEF)-like protein